MTGEQGYLDLLKELLDAPERPDRTGTGTRSLFGRQLVFEDVFNNFPLLTTKRVHFKSVVAELLWFLRGDTNVKSLQEDGCHIWDEWANEDGNLGPIYGAQWRGSNGGPDQIAELIKGLQKDPYSRRHILCAWNVRDLPEMALAPCHVLAQFYVESNGRLSCQVYQRSADIFLGVPFNIASYALLLEIIGKLVQRDRARLIMTFGDVHLYSNHVEQAREQLKRELRLAPTIAYFPLTPLQLRHLKVDEIPLVGYNPHPAIKAPVAV
jgi:thymidylate synthase